MDYKYGFKETGQLNTAKASVLSLPISYKQSVEVCKYIKGKNLSVAMTELGQVVEGVKAIPYTRFNRGGTGHKTNIGPGRYPIKTSAAIIKVLDDVKQNAKNKGLDLGKLTILHIAANKGAKSYHYGRKRRRLMKRTHIEVVVAEKQPHKKERAKAPVKQDAVKQGEK